MENPAFAYGFIWQGYAWNYIVSQTEAEGPDRMMVREITTGGEAGYSYPYRGKLVFKPGSEWREWPDEKEIPEMVADHFFGPLHD